MRAALAARGWTQADLARITGRNLSEINLLIAGKRGVSAEVARDIAAALGGTPQEWFALAIDQQLSLIPDSGADVARMARIYNLAPIREMEARGWLKRTGDADELEREVCSFFDVASLDTEPMLNLSARKRAMSAALSKEERAWAFRAKAIARHAPAAAFDPSKLGGLAARLRKHAAFPPEVSDVPRVLARFGIRFVVVEPLAGAAIDGAAFWLDEDRPVVALSLRLERVDHFWFTLCHEVAHVRHRDAWSIDANLVGETHALSLVDSERRANEEAADLLIPNDEMESFIRRVGPLYSKDRIIQFANRIKIHPGIIVGQLQRRGEVGWHANREMLVSIRGRVLDASIVDGWGRVVGLS